MVPEDEVIADTTLVVLLCEVLAEVVLNSVLVGAVVLDLVDVDGTRSLVEDSPACAMLEIVVFEKLNLEEVLLEVAVLSPGSFDGVVATEPVMLPAIPEMDEMMGVVDAAELTAAVRVGTLLLLGVGATTANKNSI
ncbi:hypothetical protein CKAH01_05318 [Colletotrichum kahawae]|uniref:Uncharacterized protein n=1 Tax=Colletotrichum kahawae TaxID=34407 RepID=A0AAE0D6U9_COLKA|nr:hypothetical protein CKAH01_05318 [Colletotrichum kahawae]